MAAGGYILHDTSTGEKQAGYCVFGAELLANWGAGSNPIALCEGAAGACGARAREPRVQRGGRA